MYEYHATLLRIVDADTLHVETDLGFDIRMRQTLRLYGINAPELSTNAGKVAKAWLEVRVPIGSELFIRTTKDRREKYGRYLAAVWADTLPPLPSLNDELVATGNAVLRAY